MGRLIPLVFGLVFGIFLAKSQATDYWMMQQLFLFQDLHIGGVMAVAIVTSAIGLTLLRRRGARAWTGEESRLVPHPRQPRTWVYGLVFGAGWALTGACPGPALAALGEGRLHILWVLGGMLLGTLLWGLLPAERPSPEREGVRAR